VDSVAGWNLLHVSLNEKTDGSCGGLTWLMGAIRMDEGPGV
jgi:hypothetical protein